MHSCLGIFDLACSRDATIFVKNKRQMVMHLGIIWVKTDQAGNQKALRLGGPFAFYSAALGLGVW
ncbi:hypothetical protein GCM10022404_24760 [Celeribacter arenosi]|uniref:Uncharacterized protein n=1 Tax=Celeribacter arenosi TaxID=792649 RepID=A0ABP7KDL9_9RHOB